MLFELAPPLVAMILLIAASAFFSASEAALFYLRPRDRKEMLHSGPGQKASARLLRDPERLLSAVLFWNLGVNMAYFALASIVSIKLEKAGWGATAPAVFAMVALLTIIFCSEMLPKSLAVLRPRLVAGLVGLILSLSVRIVDPLMPALRLVMLLSRRLLWPGFKPERYLEVRDLERAVELSTDDAQLVEQEQTFLRNIVSLTSITAEEWMRPRTQFVTFRRPVSRDDLKGQMTPSGYLLIAEEDSEEIACAINLQELTTFPASNLENHADAVAYAPWCATVADVFETMTRDDIEVTAVVNENGETIGILTLDDVLDTIFTRNPSRSKRLLDRNPIHPVTPGVWRVAGVTSLRRLSRLLETELPESRSVTIAGVVQEQLQRLIAEGDECDWGPFHLHVIEAPERGHAVIELSFTGELPGREDD